MSDGVEDQRDRQSALEEEVAITRAALERAQAASEGVDMLIAQAERRAKEEREVAVQALRDVYGALGFDTDGDQHPGAHVAGMGVAGFAHMVVAAAAEHRRDTEADYDTGMAQAERRGAVKALRRVTEHEWAYSRRAIRGYADELESGVESL